MRLTLRSMLAYMDEILEPDDSEEIGRKIADSDVATKLMQRTRDCMRKLRLGAPAVTGRGLGVDPNTVAEYLDHALPSERVPEFERICLESDVHLAEVASCHQILTLVLGEPADVDPQSRERMYQIASRVDAAEQPQIAAPPVAAPPAPPRIEVRPNLKRAKPEVPEYLRGSGVSPIRLASFAAAACLLFAVGFWLFAGPKVRQQLTALIGLGEETNQPAEKPPGDDARPNRDAVTTSDSGADDEEDSDDGMTDADDHTPAAAGRREKGAAVPPEPDEKLIGVGESSSPDEELAVDSTVGPGSEFPSDGMDANDSAIGIRRDTGRLKPLSKQPLRDDDAMPDVSVGGTNEARSSDTAREVAPPPAGVLGRYQSRQDVLARYDAKTEQWKRLQSNATLVAGNRLVTLPGFRSMMTLNNNVQVDLLGPAAVSFESERGAGSPTMVIEYGRVVMQTIGEANRTIRVRFGDRSGRITFGDAEAALALEIRWTPVLGVDPREVAAPVSADLYAIHGQVHWEADADAAVLDAPKKRSLTGVAAETSGADAIPKWSTSDPWSATEKRGAAQLDKSLVPGEPILFKLKELAASRQVEVQRLAALSSCYLGDFEPIIDALGNGNQRANWPDEVRTLSAALARGKDSAVAVDRALQKSRGREGNQLFRMLWGYTDEQLASGADAELVEALDHSELDIRVLAFAQLQSITGKGLLYKPEDLPKQRRPHVQKWQEQLRQKKIQHASPSNGKSAGVGRSATRGSA